MCNFEHWLITIRLSYPASLLGAVIGISSQFLLEYKLLDKGRRNEACAVCFFIGALVTYCWSFVNYSRALDAL